MSSFLSSARQHTPQMRKWHLVKYKFRKTEKLPFENQDKRCTPEGRAKELDNLYHRGNEIHVNYHIVSTSSAWGFHEIREVHQTSTWKTALHWFIWVTLYLTKKGLCLRLHGTQEKQDSKRQEEFVSKIDGKNPYTYTGKPHSRQPTVYQKVYRFHHFDPRAEVRFPSPEPGTQWWPFSENIQHLPQKIFRYVTTGVGKSPSCSTLNTSRLLAFSFLERESYHLTHKMLGGKNDYPTSGPNSRHRGGRGMLRLLLLYDGFPIACLENGYWLSNKKLRGWRACLRVTTVMYIMYR